MYKCTRVGHSTGAVLIDFPSLTGGSHDANVILISALFGMYVIDAHEE